VTTLELVLVVVGALAFLAIGSFVCVVIDRLPLALDEPNEYGDFWDTRPWSEVFGGRSRCSECAAPVRAVDNVPVLSWLLLRGRCRGCGARIPAFHPFVELLCPLLFLGAVWAIGLDDWRLLPALWLIPVGVAVAVIDQRTLIVPTRIVWPAFFVSVALCVVAAALEREWAWLLNAAIGSAVLAGPLFLIWFIHPRGMGFGDVRLTVLLGWNIGFASGVRPIAAVMLTLIGLVVAAVVGIVLGVVVMGARGRRAQVPFGPALIVATFFCVAFGPEILEPFSVYSIG
jgi:leader peptidase (prepilin peptidase)/N-methyltransferase